ncbi:MAG: flagellar motor protein MotA, partial [Pseudomonadota bacterium]|nr:flagellar motor protein MotA [Pseudomonadota bacterium]
IPTTSYAPQPRLLASIARMLAAHRKKDVSISAPAMRSLLDGLGTRLDELRASLRYLVGLLIFLGLLGTFWGLISTISSISDVVGNLSIATGDAGAMFSSLKADLRAPLSGMGTAFSSSLFGLAGSLILGFLDLQAGQAQNRFFLTVEDWLAGTTKLTSGFGGGDMDQPIPVYIQALLEQSAENLDDLRRIIMQSEESRRSWSGHINELTARIGTLVDQMRAEQSLMVRLGEGQLEIQNLLTRMTDPTLPGSMNDPARQHLRNLDNQMGRLIEEIGTTRHQVVGDIRGEIKILTRTIAAIAEGAEG